MQFKFACCLLLALCANLALGLEEERRQHRFESGGFEDRENVRDKEDSSRIRQHEEDREDSSRRRQHEDRVKSEQHHGEQSKGKFNLDEKTKNILTSDKIDRPDFIFEKVLEFFLKNPSRQFERECFAKCKEAESVDFVIDIAPSPSDDKLDKLLAESPMAYYLNVKHEAASPAYFNSIQRFIDAVTFDMKPEATHTVIYDNGRKLIIRGKETTAPINKALTGAHGDFSDAKRGLETLWPVASKTSVSEASILKTMLKNNLGRMTKLALWNRDNGLPTVLSSTRRSKPIYTILITDGASKAKIEDLVEDVSRTTVIDIGERRFVNNLEWHDMRKLVNLISLNAPQQLVAIVDTCRLMAARACGC